MTMSYSASVAMSVASSTGMLYLAARPLQNQAASRINRGPLYWRLAVQSFRLLPSGKRQVNPATRGST
jgi:hypothetical protein